MVAIARKRTPTGSSIDYRADRFSWAREQAMLLRAGRLRDIDAVNVAAEIDDVGSNEYSKMESALRLVLLYLLKWDYQPSMRSKSWAVSVRTHRRHFERQMRKNPGLKSELSEALKDAYLDALDDAVQETGLNDDTFPALCPYSWDEILNQAVEWPFEDKKSN